VVKFAHLRPGPSALGAAEEGASIDGGFGQLGGQLSATLDFRDAPTLPRSGLVASLGASAFAGVWSASAPFGKLRSDLATYLSLPGYRGPTLALRGGVEQAWGTYPLHESAFVGAWESLRGYETHRFAGDAAVWGGAELRMPLLRANLLVRGGLGGLVFVDAGRVYVDGESPGGWHTGSGGGLYFTFDFQGATLSSTVLYARGETDKLRMQLGLPF
jgi:outer membrane protein assembly factor BamA